MLLKVGSRGDDVKKLQSKLGLGADGVFGPGTEKEVKKWQIEHDLTPDGLVGDGTWAKMFGESTSPVSVITEPAPTPSAVFPEPVIPLNAKLPTAIELTSFISPPVPIRFVIIPRVAGFTVIFALSYNVCVPV